MSYLHADIPSAGYGKREVLKQVRIDVQKGEIVAFIGPNGAGKSTLLKVIMGLLPIEKGNVEFDRRSITNHRPEEIVKGGIGFVPQGNRVFTELSVRENLETGGYLITSRAEVKNRIESIVSLFPDLKDRLKQNAGQLSGGEKQQLALGRALMLEPKVLLLDEPSLGLSPKLVAKAFERINVLSTSNGVTILVVEQKVRDVLRIAGRVVALRMGSIVFQGSAKAAADKSVLRDIFL